LLTPQFRGGRNKNIKSAADSFREGGMLKKKGCEELHENESKVLRMATITGSMKKKGFVLRGKETYERKNMLPGGNSSSGVNYRVKTNKKKKDCRERGKGGRTM